ncbi:hypothetical protein L917_03973 [Phytophthora nicotianae]|uniref:Uncharacterized protein n=2 Tax=Phytophthora nicotianae TaxID=4792 RepID=W2HBE5_PHYNI|nr:hypothetical protein L915_04118 [Phytophthora nicotianae]ETL99126.1 hypothetical protein L917_03973 [Phytophthora nicotianae]ETM52277.1 hypothetical protein L914_04085 [Phytophthora nicotianae]ETO81360.1 hypothetical protein F444_04316 [Phytophthora nicotianae P1976]
MCTPHETSGFWTSGHSALCFWRATGTLTSGSFLLCRSASTAAQDVDVRCDATHFRVKNARSARFCTWQNCSFDGDCGNALNESKALAISRNTRTGMRGITATAPIPAGEIIGEYLGELDIFGPPCKYGPVNEVIACTCRQGQRVTSTPASTQFTPEGRFD